MNIQTNNCCRQKYVFLDYNFHTQNLCDGEYNLSDQKHHCLKNKINEKEETFILIVLCFGLSQFPMNEIFIFEINAIYHFYVLFVVPLTQVLDFYVLWKSYMVVVAMVHHRFASGNFCEFQKNKFSIRRSSKFSLPDNNG